MTNRLTGQDLETARSHAAGTAHVQLCWVYDRPVDAAGLDAFHAALQRGRLGRVAAPALLGAAGDRWTRHAEFAPISGQTDPVPAAALQDWFAEQAHADLDIYGGPAWRLAVTPLADGGGAVSLLVTHSIADGRSMLAAVAEAVSGTGPVHRYPADRHGKVRLLLSDIAAAAPKLAAAGGTWICGQAVGIGRLLFGRAPAQHPPQATPAPVDPARQATVNRVTICVPAPRWNAVAATDGGTPTTLAVAVVAGVADELGRVDAEGLVQMCLPVSLRTADNDHMANALTIVSLPVDARADAALDLAKLRSAMKQVLESSGRPDADDRRLWRLLPAIPRARWLRMISAALAASNDHLTANCSVMGHIDPDVGRIDGAPASSIGMSLVPSDDFVVDHGGILRADMLELDGRVTVRINACQPANPITAAQFRAAVARACDRYQLAATYW